MFGLSIGMALACVFAVYVGATVQALAGHYLRLRYEQTPTLADVQRFARLVRSLRVPPAPAPGSAARAPNRTAG